MKSKRKSKIAQINSLTYRLGEADQDENTKQAKYLAALRKAYKGNGIPTLRREFRAASAIRRGILAKLAILKKPAKRLAKLGN
jgi:hypothetical protein